MKKVGFVVPNFPVLSETFVGVQIRALQQYGHTIELFACDHAPYSAGQPIDRALTEQCHYLSKTTPIQLYHLGYFWRAHSFLSQQKGFYYLGLLKQGMQLACLAKKTQCQHLHAHFAWHSTAIAIVASKLLNISVSFVGHGDDIYQTSQDLSAKLNHADFVCAVTRKMQQDLQNKTNTPVHYVPCGIEYTPLHLDKLPTWQSPCKYLFIGRLVEKKGIDILLKAIALTDKALSVDIVGKGNLQEDLHKLSQTLQLSNIRFLGEQSSDWLPKHAHDYRALIAPFRITQTGSQDTGPLVIKEAMLFGIPVITTNLVGCNEILTSRTGTQVPMDNPQALADAIHHHQQRSSYDIEQQRTRAKERVIAQFSAQAQASVLSNWIEQT